MAEGESSREGGWAEMDLDDWTVFDARDGIRTWEVIFCREW